MKATKFLASGVSVILPTKSSPRVYLAINNSKIVIQSYKLYNPFSLKAKLLKSVTKFICIHFNSLAKTILPTIKHEISGFIQELETKLEQKLHSSVYFSTANDKIVLQLQNNGEIIGYLKYAISSIGKQRILNEQKAIELLTNLNIAPTLMHTGSYEQRPYIILENIEGSIGWVDDAEYSKVLKKFKKENKYLLKDHPRILSLFAKLQELKIQDLYEKLLNEVENSNKMYYEVFEHGDFAPWNLIKLKDRVVAFDFEYFEENGLQHLDEIKYHFQLNHLMHKKTGAELVQSISNKIRLPEFNIIFLVFLVKEIVNNIEIDEPYDLESSLLHILTLKAI